MGEIERQGGTTSAELEPATSYQRPIGAEGERRQVTAVFYDIVGSTELLFKNDPEEFRFIQRRVHDYARSVFESHGGYLDSVVGDGGSAYFGVPSAEDATKDAVTSALQLLALCAQDSNLVPQIRIGIATGTVLFGTNPVDWPIG